MKRGFSLIELVVIIVILSIMTVVIITRASFLSDVNAKMAANELMVNLRYVRNSAVRKDRATRVVFDVLSNSYSVDIEDPSVPGVFVPAVNPLDQGAWVVSIAERFKGVVIVNVDIDGGSVLFFSKTNGVPCGASGAPLSGSGVIEFNSGMQVIVSPETGYVALSN